MILIIYKCIEASCFFFLSFLPFSLQTDDDDDDDVFCFLCFRLAKTNVVVVVVFVDFSSFDRSLAFFASRLARRSLILTIQPCGCLTFASVVAIFLFFSSRLALSVYINIYIYLYGCRYVSKTSDHQRVFARPSRLSSDRIVKPMSVCVLPLLTGLKNM